MAAKKGLMWFSYRRRRWLAGFGAALLALLAWAVFGGGEIEVVVYNQSPQPLGAVQVEAGGVRIDFPPLAPEESAMRVLPRRAVGELTVSLPGDKPTRVAGPWIEPGETAQVIARVDEFGGVLFSQLPSWRSRFGAALR
jgi:hypothetical protein